MSSENWVVQCYSFPNSREFEKASKEQETVAYIRSNTNLSNIQVVAKIYVSLIEKETFDTIIGYSFLEELRQILLNDSRVTEDSLPMIPVKVKDAKLIKESAANEKADLYKTLYEKTANKKKICMIANIMLVIIIVAMLILTFLSGNTSEERLKTEILNEYSSWKQELEQKEDDLIQKEEDLLQKEEQLNQLQKNE